MTRRADRIIDLLIAAIDQGRSLTPAGVVSGLRANGFRPTEVGWVLRHVFGISMPEAVHIATVASEDSRSEIAQGTFLPLRDNEGPRHYAAA